MKAKAGAGIDGSSRLLLFYSKVHRFDRARPLCFPRSMLFLSHHDLHKVVSSCLKNARHVATLYYITFVTFFLRKSRYVPVVVPAAYILRGEAEFETPVYVVTCSQISPSGCNPGARVSEEGLVQSYIWSPLQHQAARRRPSSQTSSAFSERSPDCTYPPVDPTKQIAVRGVELCSASSKM